VQIILKFKTRNPQKN